MSRILLVEDNEFNRDVLSRQLARAGYEVLYAEDGPIEHRAEHQIIDRRPTGIGPGDRVLVELPRHRVLPSRLRAALFSVPRSD